MPIYEYQCTECGALHEALQKMSDPPLTDCPACGASALRKKVSAVAFRLKGSGWYETDFKSGDKKNLAGDAAQESGSKEGGKDGGDKSAKGESSGGDGASGSAKDSKPATDNKSASSGTTTTGGTAA